MGRTGLVVVIVVGCLAFPVAASAGVVSRSAGQVTFTGTDGVDTVTLDEAQDQTQSPAYGFLPVNAHTAGSQCGVTNQIAHCPDDSTSLVFNMAGGDDTVDLSQFVGFQQLPARPSTINGGLGNDILDGGTSAAVADTINGGDGNDTIRMYAGGGTANGGNGDDRFEHLEGPAVLIGGSGRDHYQDDGIAALTASLDGVANDGPGGNLDPSIEDITGTFAGNDTLVGSAGENRLVGRGGNDTIDGKGGADDLQGGDQNDTIEARDGTVDTVDCGPGTDSANVDFRDVVTNCETVNRTARDDDGDGSPNGVDCNDADAAIRPGAGEVPNNGVDEDCSGADATVDGDGDGAVPPADCDDANPQRRPGATDRPQNGVDENCDGRDSDWRTNRTVVSNRWLAFSTYTLVERLALRNIPSGGRATVKCTGGGCPFKKARRLKIRRGRANATRLFRDDRLGVGARIEIRITARDTIGKIVRYTMRSRKLPARRELCDPPGQASAKRC